MVTPERAVALREIARKFELAKQSYKTAERNFIAASEMFVVYPEVVNYIRDNVLASAGNELHSAKQVVSDLSSEEFDWVGSWIFHHCNDWK